MTSSSLRPPPVFRYSTRTAKPLTGDISSLVSLWDAGTEANEVPLIGANTVTNQLTPNTGAAGEGKVQLLSAVTTDTYSYPAAASVLKVTISTQ